METESDNAIAFLDVLVVRGKTALTTRVYRKPTHTGRYLNLNSNHPPHVKRGLIQSLHHRASTICHERQDLVKEISSVRRDLQLNGYRQGFIDSVINSKGCSRLTEERKPLGSVYIPYVKGVSEKFRRIGNRYNIRTILKTKHSLRSSLMRTRPERNPLHGAQGIYSIPCECGKSYISETGRPLAVRLREHIHNLQQGLLEKLKLAQHAYEEGHRVRWDDARILEIESNSRYRKYKESAHWHAKPIQSANPVWTFLLHGSPSSIMRSSTHSQDLYDVTNSQRFLIGFGLECSGFTP
jgi:hypothetical protein